MPDERPASRLTRASLGSAFGLAAATVVVVAGVFLAVRDATETDDPTPRPLCDEGPSPGAHLLLDLRKPVAAGASSTALQEVGRRVPTGTPLTVLAIGDDPRTPRFFVGRLCRPYGDDALQVASAKDGGTAWRDCDDLPAQISPDLREAATAYCRERSALTRRIDGLEAAAGPRVDDAYLVEAIEESIGELAAMPAPRALFVHSDMLQHAPWYSHLDLDWPEWGFDDFASIPVASAGGARGGMPQGLRVHVLYVPRDGLTVEPRAQAAHWAFWRRYFDGTDLAFETRAPQDVYTATPLMDLASAMAEVAVERGAATRRRLEAGRELRAINRAIETAEEQARTLAAAHDELAARVADLGRERLTAEAVRLRLQAELDDRASRASRASDSVVVSSTACALSLRPPLDAALAEERYVGGSTVNYGSGRMVVRYAVDSQGATLDNAVVDPERSTAVRQEHFDVLADDALRIVRSWRFRVDCGPDGAIGPEGQTGTATFIYGQKCVGAPIPRCRTVFSDAVPDVP